MVRNKLGKTYACKNSQDKPGNVIELEKVREKSRTVIIHPNEFSGF